MGSQRLVGPNFPYIVLLLAVVGIILLARQTRRLLPIYGHYLLSDIHRRLCGIPADHAIPASSRFLPDYIYRLCAQARQ